MPDRRDASFAAAADYVYWDCRPLGSDSAMGSGSAPETIEDDFGIRDRPKKNGGPGQGPPSIALELSLFLIGLEYDGEEVTQPHRHLSRDTREG